jgi:hypothetical protein
MVPFGALPAPSQTRLMIAALALAVACGCVLATVAPPEAQPCVLYGSRRPPPLAWPPGLLHLFDVGGPTDATWACLQRIAIVRELALVLVDDAFALGYGLGLGLGLAGLARRSRARPAMPPIVAGLLDFSAACFPLAAGFDLVENQLTGALLLLSPGQTGEFLIMVARYCAVPKYDLSLLVGPLTALLAAVVAVVSWRGRAGPN